MKSTHQHSVEEFMLRAKQEVPLVPTLPNKDVRIRRARLTMERSFEKLIHGFKIWPIFNGEPISADDLGYEFRSEPNLVGIIDGCCELAAVNTGDLSACGIPDRLFQAAVNLNNIQKFGLEHKSSPTHSILESVISSLNS